MTLPKNESFGFKNTYSIDIGQSLLLYEKNKSDYKKELCFNNAFKCLTNNLKLENKAVIGYVLSTDGKRKVAVRHCWNIINGQPVDVTMPANGINPISLLRFLYLPAAVYTSVDFSDAISENGGYPALPKGKKEKDLIKKLLGKHFEVLE